MTTARALSVILLAAAAAGCFGSEDALPLAVEAGDELAAPAELLGELPTSEPAAPTSLGACGELVGDYPALFVMGDHLIASQVDADALDGKLAVTGRLRVASDAPLDLAALYNLRCIAGDLRIGGAGVKQLEGLHALEYVGGHLMIEDAPSLRDLRGLRDLHFVAGELRVRLAPQLGDLKGLDRLGSVGHLVVGENAMLETLDGVEQLFDIDGGVLLLRNPVLASLDGLSSVERIGGGLHVIDNPRLPRCAIEAWAEPLVPNGDLSAASIFGNDDDGICAP